ncbi:alpha-N-acetylgalactosaminidase-like isoform X2 [Mytilus californianus]|uniref:alpha-N-acetylgalactosaminidase-like isoform X2 n=1 Tax=Mytilus californianus TaxID=6549 RepID=UPI0022483222|nr:alpha-N-acetylgalactosaminidase-like isoform X2 [Mytilus californianus]
MMWSVVILCVLLPFTIGLDNGLARTPPMGWMSWERFRCNVDCKNDPHNCISAKLLMQMADRMTEDGYLQAGYEYLSVDDCWMAKERRMRTLIADPERFPNGMKAVIDYVHSKGLKFGIYGSVGNKTCKGYPGNKYHMERDAATYAEWGVDMLKLDCCNPGPNFVTGFEQMGLYLNKTGRPILYGCSLAICMGPKVNYNLAKKYCNMWRNYEDVEDSWQYVFNIIEFYGKNDKKFLEIAGPGGWNDADQLIVGDFSLSAGQQQTQIGLWAIMAAPLFMSVDLRNIDESAKQLLLNKELLAIHQDPLGIAGKRIWNIDGYTGRLESWLRPLSPEGRYAVGIFNKNVGGLLQMVNRTMSQLGLTDENGYTMKEVFTGISYGPYKSSDSLVILLPPSNLFLAVATPVTEKELIVS